MFAMTLAFNIYMAFVMLTFRVHYSIDITTGLIVSHYCFMIMKKYQENIDNFFIYFYFRMSFYLNNKGKSTIDDHNIPDNIL